MVTGHVFIAASLDGFIARSNGDIDWLMKQPIADEDHGFEKFMASVDGLIMGRGSYEKVLSFDEWPYAKPVVVLSSRLSNSNLPKELFGKVEIIDKTPKEAMAYLSSKGWQKAYVDGGQVIQSFLRAGLIQDMVITRVPILLGSGLPLFGALDDDLDLTHIETQNYPSGLVTSTYTIQETK